MAGLMFSSGFVVEASQYTFTLIANNESDFSLPDFAGGFGGFSGSRINNIGEVLYYLNARPFRGYYIGDGSTNKFIADLSKTDFKIPAKEEYLFHQNADKRIEILKGCKIALCYSDNNLIARQTARIAAIMTPNWNAFQLKSFDNTKEAMDWLLG